MNMGYLKIFLAAFMRNKHTKKETRSVADAGESTLEENLREPSVYPGRMASPIP
jgi:hypothetical protein